MDAADVRKIRKCMHPDRAEHPVTKDELNVASQIFNELLLKKKIHEVKV